MHFAVKKVSIISPVFWGIYKNFEVDMPILPKNLVQMKRRLVWPYVEHALKKWCGLQACKIQEIIHVH